jgi:ATP-dependent DNA ligase
VNSGANRRDPYTNSWPVQRLSRANAPSINRGVYLGRSEDGQLVYAGKLETGFSEEDKRNLLVRLKPLVTKKQPIEAPRSFPKARWVKPLLMIDVEFRGKSGRSAL